jgi:lipopolysaccharide export LptBFGC system permease protein LptF
VIAPYLLTGLAGALLLFALQEYVVPPAQREANRILFKLQWRQPVNLVPTDVVFRADDKYVYVREVDTVRQELRDVVIYQRDINGGVTFLSIPVATNNNGIWRARRDPLTGRGPQAYTFDAKGNMIAAVVSIEGLDLNLRKEVWEYLAEPPVQPEELTLSQLAELRQGLRMSGLGLGGGILLDPPQLTFYLNYKFAAPLAALFGVLISIPLAIRFGRSGGYTGLLIAGAVAFCFIVSNQWARVLATHRPEPLMDPTLAAWGPVLLFAVIGGVLLAIQE